MLTKLQPTLGFLTLALVASVCGPGRTAGAAYEVRVTADRVNLRARPSGTSEVVSQVNSGTILSVEEEADGWLGVVSPDDVDLWVYGELVKDGIVTVSKLQVRSGPGINYKPVGKVNAGDRVVERGRQAGWLRIASPAGCRLWISSDYAHKPGTPTAAPAPKPAPVKVHTPSSPRSTVVSASAPAESPSTWLRRASPRVTDTSSRGGHESPASPAFSPASPAPDPSRLLASRSQGKRIQVRGLVGPAGGPLWRRPSNYRLVQSDSAGQPITACYLTGDESRLASLVGKIVVVSGREYRVQGVRQPVVAMDAVRAEDR